MTDSEKAHRAAILQNFHAQANGFIVYLWGLAQTVKRKISHLGKSPLRKNLNSIQLSYLLSMIDIQIGLKYLTGCRLLNDPIGTSYFARQLCISCCAILDWENRMRTDNLRQYFSKPKSKEAALKIEGYLADIETIRLTHMKNASILRKIRNATAHKQGTGFAQLKQIEGVELTKIESLSQGIFDIHLKLSELLQELDKTLTK